MEWACSGAPTPPRAVSADDGLRSGLFVHHTDAEREYSYDRESHMGTLDKVLDIAAENDWIIVDMKSDWKEVLPGR
jgi:hypothetical protein